MLNGCNSGEKLGPAVALWTGQERERERECLRTGGFTVLFFLLLLMPPPALPFPLPSHPFSSLLFPPDSFRKNFHSFILFGPWGGRARAGRSVGRIGQTEADDRKKYNQRQRVLWMKGRIEGWAEGLKEGRKSVKLE